MCASVDAGVNAYVACERMCVNVLYWWCVCVCVCVVSTYLFLFFLQPETNSSLPVEALVSENTEFRNKVNVVRCRGCA
jgi:hypothetical protein